MTRDDHHFHHFFKRQNINRTTLRLHPCSPSQSHQPLHLDIRVNNRTLQSMASSAPSSVALISLICLLCFAGSAHAFGAGNIGSTARIEGTRFRHGDIEDVLLTLLMARAAGGKKFGKLDVKRVCQLRSPPSALLKAKSHRFTLATGFVIIARPLMLAPSNMSAPKQSVSFYGSWASCPSAMQPRNSRSLLPASAAIAQKNTLISKLGAGDSSHSQLTCLQSQKLCRQ